LARPNSFGADTLVALADGTYVPIADVQFGDQVLAYDFDTAETVAREVTATLPHADWLLDAHFSDGTVMEVTEDHRFWSITDDAWVELQDLDGDDQLLTPNGAMVTVEWLDWDAGVTAPAWDLTVDDVHNFFVTAEAGGEPLLVHNQTLVRLACGAKVDADTFVRIAAAEDALDSETRLKLSALSQQLSVRTAPDVVAGNRSILDLFVEELESVTAPSIMKRILENATVGPHVVEAAVGTGRAAEILGNRSFATAARSAADDVLATRIATRGPLPQSLIDDLRLSDPEFAALFRTDLDIQEAWLRYAGAKSPDNWLTSAYANPLKNNSGGSAFESGGLLAAGVPPKATDPLTPAASKTPQDFDGVNTNGMASSDPGPFVPDHSIATVLPDGRVLWQFFEAKNLNPGPLYPSSNAGRQLEWLRRNPNVQGEFTLIVGRNTELSEGFIDLIRSADSAGAGFNRVEVTVLRQNPLVSTNPDGFSEIDVLG